MKDKAVMSHRHSLKFMRSCSIMRSDCKMLHPTPPYRSLQIRCSRALRVVTAGTTTLETTVVATTTETITPRGRRNRSIHLAKIRLPVATKESARYVVCLVIAQGDALSSSSQDHQTSSRSHPLHGILARTWQRQRTIQTTGSLTQELLTTSPRT